MREYTKRIFSSLSNRNFRLYFTAQFVSLTGSWMQTVALGWLAYEMTGSGIQLGIILALSTLPLLFFGIFGGMLAQRFPNYKIIQVTQVTFGVMPLVMAFLYFTNNLTLSSLYIASLWTGVIRIFDQPARQSFISVIVPKESLKNALALFNIISSFSRIVGPLIAGFLLYFYGAGVCFLLNGLSFYAMAFAVYRMDKNKFFGINVDKKEKNIFKTIKYIQGDSLVLSSLLLVAVLGTFVYNFQTTFPIYAKDVFMGTALFYSYMMSLYSMGAVVGGVTAAGNSDMSLGKIKKMGLGLAISMSLLSLPFNFYFFLLTAFFVGYFTVQFSTTLNTLIQTNTEPSHLPVVMSFFSMGIMGMTSIGSLIAGTVSEMYGVRFMSIFSGLILASVILISFRKVKLGSSYNLANSD